MQKHTEITRRRLQRFAEKMFSRLYPLRQSLTLSVYAAPDRISYQQAMQGEYLPAEVGQKFGPLWSTHWFKVSGEIPSDWQGSEVHLLWDSSSEACVWQDGTPRQGLTGSFSSWANDSLRKEFIITRQAQGGESIAYAIEMAANGLFGLNDQATNVRIGELKQAELAVFDRALWNLYWDFKIIADMAHHLPSNTPRGGQALSTANAMVNAIQLDDRATWQTSHTLASQFLNAHNGDGQHNLSAIGHAHIDTAWLWPIAETVRKAARSFASAVRYMDDYPSYKFACSQAQQYAWMKDDYPDLYARMQAKIESGQFIPVGGTWIEPDCNLPSGESLVRQFLFGQRFFEAEFGMRCQEFWNPDVFGYSGALPQIMRLAGIKYFLTQKLSWNQFNKPTSHTFLWEGIDGSQVLTHFPPADTYNAEATVKQVLYNVSNFKDHDRANESYMLFGYGDGGGGPTPAMLEQIQRMGDVDGLPRVEIRSPREFFARCEADIKDPTVWVGELYFELHRGTYTSQAHNKYFNRQSEILLHDVEFLAAMAWLNGEHAYPTQELDWLWKRVLTNQFHDIIPGSSIHEVYEDSTADYIEILGRGATLKEAALNELVGADSRDGTHVAVVNTLGFARSAVVEVPDAMASSQTSANGHPLGMVNVPSLGYAVTLPITAVDIPVTITTNDESVTLENSHLIAILNAKGGLTSLIHKATGRQSLEGGSIANQFILYDDDPNDWEAWDVDVFHLEKTHPLDGAISMKILEEGPLRGMVEFTYQLSTTSQLVQQVSLEANAPRLDFDTHVDWHEQRKFLKVEFPLNVRSHQATYEIQFGHVQRPTHFNTTWDLARFEVCAHKWADLSEVGFGVALLNDSKYGYAAHGNILRLSLLRAPLYPDAEADQGEHHFRYALMPHAGTFQDAGVIQQAAHFNVSLTVRPTKQEATTVSYFEVDSPSVVIDTVKKAEDSATVIVRLYEAHGGRGKVCLTSPLPIVSATLCNLLEDDGAELAWQDGGLDLTFTPFQIVTVKLKF